MDTRGFLLRNGRGENFLYAYRMGDIKSLIAQNDIACEV